MRISDWSSDVCSSDLAGAAMRAEGVDKVSIPAGAVQEFFQSSGDVDPVAWLRGLGVSEEQYAEALATGGDVDMTPEAYAQHIYGTDTYQKIGRETCRERECQYV